MKRLFAIALLLAGAAARAQSDVPQVTRVAMALRDKGIAINPAVYTVDELSKELVALKRGGGKKC
jgi:hypothetical protein